MAGLYLDSSDVPATMDVTATFVVIISEIFKVIDSIKDNVTSVLGSCDEIGNVSVENSLVNSKVDDDRASDDV